MKKYNKSIFTIIFPSLFIYLSLVKFWAITFSFYESVDLGKYITKQVQLCKKNNSKSIYSKNIKKLTNFENFKLGKCFCTSYPSIWRTNGHAIVKFYSSYKVAMLINNIFILSCSTKVLPSLQ